jgi:uncharacterized membrane protein
VPGIPASRKVSAERWRSSLWLWPLVAGGGAFVAAVALTRIRPADGTLLTGMWRGGPVAAMNVLTAIATSVMTATALIFSLTVLALQLASQQFSPRLLREFASDPVTKQVLSLLSATFVFSLVAASGLAEDEDVPTIAVTLGLLLGVASLNAILAFIAHIVRVLRVETMMVMVHDQASDAIETFYPPYDDHRSHLPEELDLDDEVGVLVSASRSGFVQMTDVEGLVSRAAEDDVVVRIHSRAGDHIVQGTPIATVWGRDGAPLAEVEDGTIAAIRSAIQVGYERTIAQDAGFGFRQLEDIAVRAMSPSVNDPVTAAHAVGHMGDLLARLVGCRLGPTLHLDGDGVGRAVVPDRDLRYYLELSCGQLRRFSTSEPSVLVALLRSGLADVLVSRMLRDTAASCRDDHQRLEVRRAAAAIVEGMDASVIEVDAESVLDLRSRVELALEGDLTAAFGDRAGETRSM